MGVAHSSCYKRLIKLVLMSILAINSCLTESVPYNILPLMCVRLAEAQRKKNYYPFLQAMKGQPTELEPVPMDSEDDLFIAYTSGTLDKPRRIVHSQAGYLLYTSFTHKVCNTVEPP